MTERIRSSTSSTTTTGYQFSNTNKMENELSPRKTMLVLVIVVGCFAVLWPKVFYPMLMGTVNQHIKPSPIDKMTGCCDVISETDINTIKIMSELCGTIIKSKEDKDQKRLNNREIVQICRQEVLETCGIDIAAVLQEQIRLGQNTKQILDEVRSLNGSLCLKYNYGIAPWRLGVPHRITIKNDNNIRQERPHHLRSELIHPAFRERGRAIPPQPQQSPKPSTRPPPRIVEGRPGPIPGMRPTIGGAGHVVPPSKQSTSSMSVIMPIYTIGIVIFFTYTLMKIIFKKQPEGIGGGLYPPVVPDPHFRKEVFESDRSRLQSRVSNGRESNKSSKLVVNAMSALLDEVDQEIEARRKSNDIAAQDLANGSLSNGDALKPHENNVADDQPTVKVLGMEMRASCEGGKKWSRPSSPILPTSATPQPEPVPPPQEIYLEGALPAQSHLLVADSATEPQPSDSGEDPAVVLAGKMTLSVISLDSSENGGGNKSDEERQKLCEEIDEEIKNLEKVAGTESQTSSIPQEPESVAKEFEIIEELKDPIVDMIESVNAEITPEVLESEVLESRQEVQIDKGSETEQIPPVVIELEVDSETVVKESEAIEEPILEVQKEISDTKEKLQSELEQTAPKEETPVLGTEITEIKQPEETVAETKTETIQEAAVEPEAESIDKQIQFQVEPSVKEHIDENIEKEVDDLINEALEQVKTIQDLKTTAEIEEIVEKTSRESSEIGSNEEIEIEEVVYTSNDEDVEEEEEEIEVEEDEDEEEEEGETHEHKRFNGDTGAEESKHTTTTSHTVAENEVSEGTDNEEVEDEEEEEIIEIVDDDDDEEEEQADNVGLNHIAGGSGEED